MSSTNPPSRIPPRETGVESKAARESLSSKGKVEKVREVDPDEETRKKKFLKYYKDDEAEPTGHQEEHPTPFDLYSDRAKKTKGPLGSERQNLGDVENAAIPSPPSSPPPSLGANQAQNEEEDGASSTKALPQSEGFWEDTGLPDEPRSNQYRENSNPSEKKESKTQKNPSLIEEFEAKLKGKETPHTKSEKKEKDEKIILEKKQKQIEEHSQLQGKAERVFQEDQEVLGKRAQGQKEASQRFKKEEKKEREDTSSALPLIPSQFEEKEFAGGDKKREDGKTVEIEAPSLPTLPCQIQPMAMSATVQATPYLHPETTSLFFQMVGTIYVMQNSGVNRTEIVLNNPSYSNSKFFGATITIEKYATAPDSFNIRLSGSNAAVVTFKENIPSLMSAFENGNLRFRIGRIDVDYKAPDRPLFRRKERSSGKGDAGGESLDHRR